MDPDSLARVTTLSDRPAERALTAMAGFLDALTFIDKLSRKTFSMNKGIGNVGTLITEREETEATRN